MINFVAYHVNFNDNSRAYLDGSSVLVKENILTKLRSGEEDFNYVEMISTMFKSARLFHPGCKCTILTDKETDFSSLEGVEIYRFEIDPRKIILSRLIAQIDYLKRYEGKDDLLFIDSDIVINANLDHVFCQDFDIGVTFRESKKDMPLNGGMLFVSMKRKECSLAFFERMYEIYKNSYLHNDVWWGDQFALRDAIGQMAFSPNTIIESDGAKVLCLPCSEYNYKPPESYRYILSRPAMRKAIHFQGRRKKIMRVYRDVYIASGNKGPVSAFISALKNKTILLSLVVKEILSGEVSLSGKVKRRMQD